MAKLPQDELFSALSVSRRDGEIDNQTALRLKKKLAEEFREQLAIGIPTNHDEIGLRRLAAQIRAKKLVVKLFLRHPLHAKLYLLHLPHPINPIVGYLGSSNLTFAGLSKQGELNVDVLDYDAGIKLAKWFEDRWRDHWCIDISDELAQIIEQSWAREDTLPPYHIYVKISTICPRRPVPVFRNSEFPGILETSSSTIKSRGPGRVRAGSRNPWSTAIRPSYRQA
jgi:hypothetical protein